jgi:hypothetical protein
VVICLATLFAASLPLYVFPPQSAPKPADVVFVIGPPLRWRIAWARQLIAAGDARALMISVPDPASATVCHSQQGYPVFCQRVTPFTTQGEARWLQGRWPAVVGNGRSSSRRPPT